MPGSRAVRKKPSRKTPSRKTVSPVLRARTSDQVALEVYDTGKVGAYIGGEAYEIGTISPAAVKRAHALRTGLPLASLAAGRRDTDREVEQLTRYLARRGLLEYGFGPPGGEDLAVIEPQVPDYWPQIAALRSADRIVLSRFAYLRRRGHDLVLESPRSPALLRLRDPAIAAAILGLATPQTIGRMRRQKGFVGPALLGLLLACDLLFKVEAGTEGLRPNEGDDDLVVWDFHDLLFHTHSTEGRQANVLGGLYPHIDRIAPPSASRPSWGGTPIDLTAVAGSARPSIAALLRARRSVRDFDDAHPIQLAELAQFLDAAARVQSKWTSPIDFGEGDLGPDIDYTSRPYPSAGSAYELELYLTVSHCDGLERGLYHYDAEAHALVPIEARTQVMDAQLAAAVFAMDAPTSPQILITIAARFSRVAWKYSAIAYALVLKDVGVLLQTLYLTATDMGLGGCAIGTSNVDLFARLTGQPFHVEGPVGQFALGRGRPEDNSADAGPR